MAAQGLKIGVRKLLISELGHTYLALKYMAIFVSVSGQLIEIIIVKKRSRG